MNDALLQLAIMCGLLGLLIGFGIAFWAADAVYWRAERRKRQRARSPEEIRRMMADNPFVPASGVPAAIENVKADDGPLTADTALLAPGEVAVFDEKGALIVWFPSPDSDSNEVVCLKSITILTYDDMPTAAPGLREQLRVLKGGQNER